ncbi:MAG: hypothetical protein ACTSQ8_27170 [Candidatus Helarchaeota archaeon]
MSTLKTLLLDRISYIIAGIISIIFLLLVPTCIYYRIGLSSSSFRLYLFYTLFSFRFDSTVTPSTELFGFWDIYDIFSYKMETNSNRSKNIIGRRFRN